MSNSGFTVHRRPDQRSSAHSLHDPAMEERGREPVGGNVHLFRTLVCFSRVVKQYESLSHCCVHFIRDEALWSISDPQPTPRGVRGCHRSVDCQSGGQRPARVRLGALRSRVSRLSPGDRQLLRAASLRCLLTVFMRADSLLRSSHV